MTADHLDWHYLEAKNWRKKRRSAVTGVVQHYTAAGDGLAVAKWFAGKAVYEGKLVDAPMSSAHVIICRDGAVIQQVPLASEAFHAGEANSKGRWKGKPQPENVNHFTVGIENSNYGILTKTRTGFKTSSGRTYRGLEPQQALDHEGVERWWEPYPEALLQSNIQVLKRVVQLYPAVTRADVQSHSDVAPYRKHDPGPLFPHARILDAAFPKSGDEPLDDDNFLVLQANRGDLDHYDLDEEMCIE